MKNYTMQMENYSIKMKRKEMKIYSIQIEKNLTLQHLTCHSRPFYKIKCSAESRMQPGRYQHTNNYRSDGHTLQYISKL